MQPYLDAAKTFGANVEIIVAVGEYGSVHNVPKKAMEAMKARFEWLPLKMDWHPPLPKGRGFGRKIGQLINLKNT